MNRMLKSFAVSPEPVPRKAAYSPRSSEWTLYKPKAFREALERETGANVPVEACETALEQTGFTKAVRQREEIIRWKERLRAEQRELGLERQSLQRQLREVKARESLVREMLENIRNILRISRESPSNEDSGE